MRDIYSPGEFSPEKAGVGGSTPSITTTVSIKCMDSLNLKMMSKLRVNWG
jgi:hypothetical protein